VRLQTKVWDWIELVTMVLLALSLTFWV
jgi:hypothetical protein